MVKFGVDKFESDVLNLTLVKPTNATSIDSAKLKKKYPDKMCIRDRNPIYHYYTFGLYS